MKWLVIAGIRLYQMCIAPLIHAKCRFQPTCSQYAIYAVSTKGVCRGLFLTVKRLIRCRPRTKTSSQIGIHWGYDPVPQTPTTHSNRAHAHRRP